VHQGQLVEVEDSYRQYLEDEGLSQHERAERLKRLGHLSDATLLRVHACPKEYWAPLLDSLPASRWGGEFRVAQELARLQGQADPPPDPAPQPTGGAAVSDPPDAGTTPTASDQPAQPDRSWWAPAQDDADDQLHPDLQGQDAFDRFAKSVVGQRKAAEVRKVDVHTFAWQLENVHEVTMKANELRALAVEVLTAAQAEMAKAIIAVWTDIVESAAHRPHKPTGVDTTDDPGPYTG
jgi:hypothetical protein